MIDKNKLDQLFKNKLGESKGTHPEHLWEGIELRLDQINGGSNKRRILFLSIALLTASLMIGSAFVYNYYSSVDVVPTSINKNIEPTIIKVEEVLANIEEPKENLLNEEVPKRAIVNVNYKSIKNDVRTIIPLQNSHSFVNNNAINSDTHNVIVRDKQKKESFFYNESGNLVKSYPILITKKDIVNTKNNLYSFQNIIDYSTRPDITKFVSKDGCLDLVDKAYNRMYLDVLGGSQMTDRLLYTENVAWQDNVNIRNESESVKNSYSFGLRFTYMFDRGVSLKTGILYSVINEEFKYVSGIKTITIRDEQTGEITRQYEEKEYALNNNRYVFYDIPLLISYNWTRKKVFAEFNSGIIMNIYANQSGEFYTQKEERVKFNTPENEPFRSFVGGSLYTSAAFGYNFPNNNVSFFVEPHVRYHLASISSKSYPVKQKYVNYGLYLGLRYQIK